MEEGGLGEHMMGCCWMLGVHSCSWQSLSKALMPILAGNTVSVEILIIHVVIEILETLAFCLIYMES